MSDNQMPDGFIKKTKENNIDSDRLIFTIGLVDSNLISLADTFNSFNELASDTLLTTLEPFENFKLEISKTISNFSESMGIATELLNNIPNFNKTEQPLINNPIVEEEESPLKPTRQMVARAGDIGALYLADVITNAFPNPKKRDDKTTPGFGSNVLQTLLGTALGGKLIKIAAKFGGFGKLGLAGGITASLLWLAIDGIKGFFKAEDWGTSKLSAVVGSVFAGTDSNLKNAFVNAGKFAVLGATIGAVVPVIGTLIGGIIGAALGGVLGFFGGEKLALGFDAIYSKIKDEIIPNIGKVISDYLSFAKGEVSGEELIKSLKKLIPESVTNFFTTIIDAIKSFDLGEFIGNFFIEFFDYLKEGLKNGILNKDTWKEPTEKKPAIDLMKGGWRDTGKGMYNADTQEFRDYEGNVLRKGNEPPPKVTKTNDAIITKTGDIIHTNPDDNIIATKNMPVIDNEIKSLLTNLKTNVESPSNSGNENLIAAINNLISSLATVGQIKNIFANNTNNNSGFDYESLKRIPV